MEDVATSDEDEVDHDDPQVMEECLKMYNEYEPSQEDVESQVTAKKVKVIFALLDGSLFWSLFV